MKSDWLLPALHFGYGRKGPEEAAHAYRRSLLFFYRIEASRRCPLCPESRHVQCAVPDVRFGPIADISQRTHHVLTPERGANQKHKQAMAW